MNQKLMALCALTLGTVALGFGQTTTHPKIQLIRMTDDKFILKVLNHYTGEEINGFDIWVEKTYGGFSALYRVYGTNTDPQCTYGVIEPGETLYPVVVGIDNPSFCDAQIPAGWTLECDTRYLLTLYPLNNTLNFSNTLETFTLPCE